MGRWTAERWAASTGIGFVVLLLVGNLIGGTPKKYNASAADITSYLQDKHKQLLVAAILYGVAYVLFLWFLASFAGLFREAGQRRLSTVMYGAGVATITIGAIGDATGASVARLVYFVDPKTVQGLYAMQAFIYGRLFWTASALGLATAIATRRSKALPDWYAWLSFAAAAVAVVGGLSLKTTGFFSPAGAMAFIAFYVMLAWVLITSILLVQKTAEAALPAPAHSAL